jgi:hypothetical protein
MALAQVHSVLADLGLILMIDGLMFCLLLAASVLWYKATKIIPTDSVQLRHLSALQKGYFW